MTAAEKFYQLIQTLPEEQINEIIYFVEFLHHNQRIIPSSQAVPIGTLTGLRGIAKRPDSTPNDQHLQDEYTDYLIQKYL